MDVERIQKINDLALDLMKQGLAQSRDEALRQAEKIFSSDRVKEYSEIQETMHKEEPQIHTATSEDVDLSHDKIKNILEQNTTFLVKKIKEFQNKVDSLHREMDVLRTKLNYKDLPTVKQIVAPEEPQEPEIQEVRSTEEPTEEKKSHPRSGSYEDKEVSIEKFFYMGNK